MRIRQLKKGSASVWPPDWGSAYKGPEEFPRGEEGYLESVVRHADGLMLTLKWKGKTYGPEPLVWDPPPTVDEVETVLSAHRGEPIQSISDLEVRI